MESKSINQTVIYYLHIQILTFPNPEIENKHLHIFTPPLEQPFNEHREEKQFLS